MTLIKDSSDLKSDYRIFEFGIHWGHGKSEENSEKELMRKLLKAGDTGLVQLWNVRRAWGRGRNRNRGRAGCEGRPRPSLDKLDSP